MFWVKIIRRSRKHCKMICFALCTLLCVVFVTYVIVAYTFLKYPSLVPKFISGRKNWKHENRFRDVVHISHRGKFISVISIIVSLVFVQKIGICFASCYNCIHKTVTAFIPINPFFLIYRRCWRACRKYVRGF